MRLLLLAGPGGGKGTQGARLAERLEVEHVAAGDALRAEVARGTEIGTRVAGYVDAGELVPDDVVVDLMTPIAAAAAQAGGYILDGFPRNLAQAHVADDAWERRGIGLEAVVYLEVPEPELRRRLLARAQIEERSDDTPGGDRQPPGPVRARRPSRWSSTTVTAGCSSRSPPTRRRTP